jgi:hypothetical protein
MKNVKLILIFLILLPSCSTNRYLLTNDGVDEEYLVGVIKEMARDGQISKKPLVVVDLVPHIFQKKLKEYRLPISKEMINEIWSLEKYAGEAIYGTIAEGGVLVINTKQFLTTVNSATNYNKVLFLLETHKLKDQDKILTLLDGKEISKKEIDNMNLNELESIRLAKDTETIEKYSSEGFHKIFILKR